MASLRTKDLRHVRAGITQTLHTYPHVMPNIQSEAGQRVGKVVDA
ncbi:MAG: hypothetical protein OXG64_04070 [Chloroflexi bacterium]|nr:hypothetical protein [Chloroflexota bacterium]